MKAFLLNYWVMGKVSLTSAAKSFWVKLREIFIGRVISPDYWIPWHLNEGLKKFEHQNFTALYFPKPPTEFDIRQAIIITACNAGPSRCIDFVSTLISDLDYDRKRFFYSNFLESLDAFLRYQIQEPRVKHAGSAIDGDAGFFIRHRISCHRAECVVWELAHWTQRRKAEIEDLIFNRQQLDLTAFSQPIEKIGIPEEPGIPQVKKLAQLVRRKKKDMLVLAKIPIVLKWLENPDDLEVTQYLKDFGESFGVNVGENPQAHVSVSRYKASDHRFINDMIKMFKTYEKYWKEKRLQEGKDIDSHIDWNYKA